MFVVLAGGGWTDSDGSSLWLEPFRRLDLEAASVEGCILGRLIPLSDAEVRTHVSRSVFRHKAARELNPRL